MILVPELAKSFLVYPFPFEKIAIVPSLRCSQENVMVWKVWLFTPDEGEK